MGKYSNKKAEQDGYTFDSLAEHRRYKELLLLWQAGEITGLEVHPTYELLPAFRDRAGKRHKAITYTADFRYMAAGVPVVEDVKGMRTEVFRIKEKLFRRWFGHIDFRIIEV